jgi:hypothetical protein
MKISMVITTCSGDPDAFQQQGGGGIYSATMYDRQRMLREELLPAAIAEGMDEIWVVGRYPKEIESEFEDDVNFVFLPPMRLNRIEAFRERECGARFSTGDLLVMSSDDHKVGPGFGTTLREIYDEDTWDIIQPKRIHGITGEELPDGRGEQFPDYSPWHLQCYRRWVWAMNPFTAIDTLWCDIDYPPIYEQIGAKLTWDERLVCIDVEAKEGER